MLERYRNDTRYSLHDLEWYLQPFRKTMTAPDADGGDGGGGGARSTMCAYQSVNGVPVCANGFVLDRVVKGECDPLDAQCGSWGWDGFVSSDCDSVQTMMPPHFDKQPEDTPGWPGHNYSWNGVMAAADALRGGGDSNCGGIFADDEQGVVAVNEAYPDLVLDGIVDKRLRAVSCAKCAARGEWAR